MRYTDVLKQIERLFANAKYFIVTLEAYGKSRQYGGIFPYLNLYIVDKRNRFWKIIYTEHPYWDKKKRAYAMKVWGTDRVFELLYAFPFVSVKDVNKYMSKILRL